MRITQQMLAQLNTVPSSSKMKVDGTVELKALVGKSLEGRLFGIQANGIAMFATGDAVLTVDLAGTQAFENQPATLKITGMNDGMLTAKVIADAPGEMGTPIGELLSKLGVNDTPENRAILNAMKEAGLPMSKEVFSTMRQGVLEVKFIQSEIHQMNDAELSREMETPLKQLAIKLIQGAQASNNQIMTNPANPVNPANPPNPANSANPANPANSANSAPSGQVASASNPISIDTATLMDDKQAMASKVQASASQSMAQVEEGTSELSRATTAIIEPDEGQPLSKEDRSRVMSEGIKNTFSETSLKDSVKLLLSTFDLPQESLLVKNALPLSIKNLFLAYNLLSDDHGIGARFENLLSQIDGLKLDKTSLETLVKMLSSDQTEVEKLQELSEWVKKTMSDSEIISGIEREVTVIKESVSLTKPLNDQLFYMQMPIKIEERLEQVEIYYKRNKKKVDPNDITLLVALNTKNTGEVRCLINKVKNQFNLHFTLENQEIMTLFQSESSKLEKALEVFSDRAFSIHFSVKAEDEIEMDRVSLSQFGFDYKV